MKWPFYPSRLGLYKLSAWASIGPPESLHPLSSSHCRNESCIFIISKTKRNIFPGKKQSLDFLGNQTGKKERGKKMQRFLARSVLSGRELPRWSRCFSSSFAAEAQKEAVNGVDVPKIPPFHFSPPPYDGPSADEILTKRKEFLSPSMFYFYKKPVSFSLSVVVGSQSIPLFLRKWTKITENDRFRSRQ